MVYHSALDGRPIADGEVVIVFNQPIELDPTFTAASVAERIDDAFFADIDDTDGDGVVYTFHPDDSDQEQEKGTSFSIEGNVLTLSWNRDDAFQTEDPDDVIAAVEWGALDWIYVRPVGGGIGERVNVASLVGSSTIEVPLIAF